MLLRMEVQEPPADVSALGEVDYELAIGNFRVKAQGVQPWLLA